MISPSQFYGGRLIQPKVGIRNPEQPIFDQKRIASRPFGQFFVDTACFRGNVTLS